MLANMIYTPGEQFVWLPLKTGGTGKASGLELFLRGHVMNRMYGIASLTYARTKYAAADSSASSSTTQKTASPSQRSSVLISKR